uniref:sulfatase family protein n=1 Tax=uncultured Draconibacterium sp. TaxID=1573823 RepID=UPI003217F0EE
MNLKLICISLAVIFSIASCSSKKEADNKKPNIIYVLADDLGYGDVGCYNSDAKINTPQLNKLASEGMIFTDAHTSSSVCTPTRYGILTGRYNWRTKLKQGVLSGKSPALINTERETVASLLKKAGYYTAFIGKWHLGWGWDMDENNNIDFSKPVKNSPNTNGFDYAYGHCGSLDMPPYVYVENGMSTAIPVDSTENTDFQGMWRKGLTAPDFVHEEVTPHFFQKSFEFIKQQAKSDNPFFLYLPLPSPHTPILPTEEWQGKSGLNPYGDFVIMVDDYMGQLEATIKEAGIEGNTLIIFTSDNGCSPRANFPELIAKGHNPSYIFRGHKADIFEGGHRVPFIVKWPKVIQSGTTCEKTICLTDLMATCASVTDSELAENAAEDSYSLLSLLKNPTSGEFHRETTVHHSINGSFAIRKGDWKFILCPDSGGWSYPHPKKDNTDDLPHFQLYNLKNDPGEQNNLYGKYPEVELKLKQELVALIKNGRSTPGEAQKNDGEQWWPHLSWMEAGVK